MNDFVNKVYIGTILLEKNRWSSRIPSYRVSEWIKRFSTDGFDGMELWENHVLLTDDAEIAAIKSSGLPIAVFNSYAGFEDDDREQRIAAAYAIKTCKAEGVKFNLGKDPFRIENYLTNLREWIGLLPDSCRVLCECHPGTVLEKVEQAAEVLHRPEMKRVQIIVHPLGDPKVLEKWFAHFGKRITHAHIQMRDGDGKIIKLNRNPSRIKESLAVMKMAGFEGSYTLEFTEGTRTPGENAEDLYRCALEDLEFLKGCIK